MAGGSRRPRPPPSRDGSATARPGVLELELTVEDEPVVELVTGVEDHPEGVEDVLLAVLIGDLPPKAHLTVPTDRKTLFAVVHIFTFQSGAFAHSRWYQRFSKGYCGRWSHWSTLLKLPRGFQKVDGVTLIRKA